MIVNRYSMELLKGAEVRGRRASSDDLNALIVYARGYLAAAYDFSMWRLSARIMDSVTGKEVYKFEENAVVQ